jgi:hypothetical protein
MQDFYFLDIKTKPKLNIALSERIQAISKVIPQVTFDLYYNRVEFNIYARHSDPIYSIITWDKGTHFYENF